MVQLRQDYPKFTNLKADVVAVGPEKPEKFRAFWQQENMPFVGIPDPDHTIAKLYGQQVKTLKLGRMPAVLIIDKSGNIRYRHFGKAMWDIPKNEQLFSLLEELNSTEG